MIVAGFEFVSQICRRISIKIEIYVPFIYVVFSCFIPSFVRDNAMNFFFCFIDLPADMRVAWPVSMIEVKFEVIFHDLSWSISLSFFYLMTVAGVYLGLL